MRIDTMRASGTTASAPSSYEARSVRPLASFSPSSYSSGDRGQFGLVLDSVLEELGRNVIAYVKAPSKEEKHERPGHITDSSIRASSAQPRPLGTVFVCSDLDSKC